MQREGLAVAICILISNGERFHGQYREIYRDAVCDDILHNETGVCAGHTAGPTHGGAPAPPHTFGTARRKGWPNRPGGGGKRRITSLLFWYLYQCARCSHPPKSS
jgi:hypothetical protein